MFRYFYFVLVFAVFTGVQAQNADKDVLFSVDGDPVYAEEFTRIFNKNLDLVKDESQKDVDEYLKLFINYKLKLKEAQAKGLDKKPSYIRELGNYKTQLAKNYLTDTEVTDELVAEAYQRVSNEVKASHILIRLDEGARPEDTLSAYNELLKLRERVLKEGFDAVQADVHNGKTVYAENLGYFTGFKMVYDFENVAYKTQVGDMSMPFKTRFGYHIVLVEAKRPSRGERTVAHIMIGNQKDGVDQDAEGRIRDIYKKLQQGDAFESLAKQFSEDKSSANKGGKLASFEGGQLSSTEFENVAFGLENVDAISEPFKTDFGWHIMKLYDKKGIGSFESMKSELEAKVKRDSRSQLINTSITNTLKERYDVSDKQSALPYFVSIMTADYFRGQWKLPEGFNGDKPLVKIDKKQLTYHDFGDFLLKSQRKATPQKPLDKLVAENYTLFLDSNLMQYQEDNLENESEDFAHIVAEYRDGLLLFDLMETEIWNAAKTDSAGLHNFYEAHKNDYFWNQRIESDVASSSDKSIIKKVQKFLEAGKTPEAIKETLNTADTVQVIFTSGMMAAQHQAIPSDMEFKTGVSKIYNHNEGYVVVLIKSVLPKELKSFDDARGQIISDYQTYKEEKWLQELQNIYPIQVNDDVLTKIKNQIKNN